MEYYNLLTGLPDLQADNAKSAPELRELLEELRGVLSKHDNALLNVLLMRYDNDNLLAYLENNGAELNDLGLLTADDWHEILTILADEDNKEKKDARLQKYVKTYYETINDEEKNANIESKEDLLTSLYYEFGMGSKNRFIAEWFEFCLNMNNVIAAVICRKHGFNVKTAVISDNEIADALRSSGARDFGLVGQFDYVDKFLSVAEESNPLDREKKMDALKWEWLEDHTFFDHFSVENVLSYWIRCELMHRWDCLSVEQGKEVFRGLLNEMKKDIHFE
ncbi:MAG: DUF2764 domain-containing protein [Paludibacteraceae bacterium]|nr:DUF2764 domain-containing protein [Paludibacteraceae bacterium]